MNQSEGEKRNEENQALTDTRKRIKWNILGIFLVLLLPTCVSFASRGLFAGVIMLGMFVFCSILSTILELRYPTTDD